MNLWPSEQNLVFSWKHFEIMRNAHAQRILFLRQSKLTDEDLQGKARTMSYLRIQ